ncbi:hypothetical protein B0T14DRAFT_463482, partial [Immersiella caudata]
MTSLTFRLATPTNVPQLTKLINTSFRNDPTTDVFLSLDHKSIDVIDNTAMLALLARPETAVFAVANT